jgi:NitT/TauT family transport system ATP-binding protein
MARRVGCKLSVDHVSHYFTSRSSPTPLAVLDDIDLRIGAGQFVALAGASGCGKSTLLRILSGLVRPSSGQVLHDGTRVTRASQQRGMVFQADAVFPWLTVRQNVQYGPKRRGVPRRELNRLADHWCDLVGLAEFKDAYPKELSGGMRKRVDLARVYANDPDVLLMDEPFGALDTQTKNRMQEEVLKLWQTTQKTVVFVTHDLEEAVFLADTVIVMSSRPGRIASAIGIPLPRPRTDEMRLSEAFLALRRSLRSAMLSNGHGED